MEAYVFKVLQIKKKLVSEKNQKAIREHGLLYFMIYFCISDMSYQWNTAHIIHKAAEKVPKTKTHV